MLTFEEFAGMVEEEVKALPEYVHDKLDGGVLGIRTLTCIREEWRMTCI